MRFNPDNLKTHCPNCGGVIAEPPPPESDPEFDDQRHMVKGIKLTGSEWALLQVLRRRPGWLVTSEQAIQAIYGETRDEPEYAANIVKVMVCHLRTKFYRADVRGWKIETIWGRGYIARRQQYNPVSPEP
jgi:DNA-binding response OmpR family regulator